MNPSNLKLILALLFSVFASILSSSVSAQQSTQQISSKNQSRPDVAGVIVKYRQVNQRALIQQAANSSRNRNVNQPNDVVMRARRITGMTGVNVKFQHQMGTGAYVFRSSEPMSLKQALAMSRKIELQDKQVEYAEPDYINTHQSTPSSPLFSLEQWSMQERTESNLGALNLPSAWDISLGRGVTVAVIDTGILYHPDIKNNILEGYNFISDPEKAGRPGKTQLDQHGEVLRDANGLPILSARSNNASDEGDHCDTKNPPSPSSWHGTHVAGTIAAHAGNTHGVTGVAPKAKLLPVRALGKCGGASSDITDGMIWAAGGVIPGVPPNKTPAQILNLSLGGTYPCTRSYREAIEAVTALGAIVVVAAGNSTENASGFSPASCPGVISVAANGKTSGIASYSNYGSFVTVTAPGGDADGPILSTNNSGKTVAIDHNYDYKAGTSMATPHVAGVVALMLSVNPRLDFKAVRRILINTAHAPDNDCEGCSEGIVDAAAAVKAAVSN